MLEVYLTTLLVYRVVLWQWCNMRNDFELLFLSSLLINILHNVSQAVVYLCAVTMEIFQNHVSYGANAVSILDFLAWNAVWLVNCDLWRIWYEVMFACIGVPHNLELSAGTEESNDRPFNSLYPSRGWSRTPPTQFSSVIVWANLLSYHCWQFTNSDIPLPFILLYTLQDACNMKVPCS